MYTLPPRQARCASDRVLNRQAMSSQTSSRAASSSGTRGRSGSLFLRGPHVAITAPALATSASVVAAPAAHSNTTGSGGRRPPRRSCRFCGRGPAWPPSCGLSPSSTRGRGPGSFGSHGTAAPGCRAARPPRGRHCRRPGRALRCRHIGRGVGADRRHRLGCFARGSYGSLTRRSAAVAGISCIRPIAPFEDLTRGSKADSTWMTARTSSGRTL